MPETFDASLGVVAAAIALSSVLAEDRDLLAGSGRASLAAGGGSEGLRLNPFGVRNLRIPEDEGLRGEPSKAPIPAMTDPDVTPVGAGGGLAQPDRADVMSTVRFPSVALRPETTVLEDRQE